MPLYEYECDACAHRFEVIQKFSDPPADTCPSCGGTVRRLLSSPAIQFKGSGWYITDYARKGSGGGAEKTAKEKPSSEGKGADSAATSSSGESGKSETSSSSTPSKSS
jgi:putative FmdB family regulatory protein